MNPLAMNFVSPKDLANVNDKIIFDCYYCINSSRKKEVTMHYILQPHHFFMSIKVFILMLIGCGFQLLIISMCFAWGTVTSINIMPCINSNSARESLY